MLTALRSIRNPRLSPPSRAKGPGWGIELSRVSGLILCLILAACATSPKLPQDYPHGPPEFVFLPEGAAAYLFADIANLRPALEKIALGGMTSKDTARILDRTQSAAAAYYPRDAAAGDAGRSFIVVGKGSYPSGMAGFSFTTSSAWKKVKSLTGNRYWFSGDYGISVALGSELALVSDGDPFISSPAVRPPEEFRGFQEGKSLAGWLSDAQNSVNRFLETLQVPIRVPAEEFYFSLQNAPETSEAETWEMGFRIGTPSEQHARGLATLISMARIFSAPGGEAAAPEGTLDPRRLMELLFYRLPEQEGKWLNLRSGPMSAGEIALLFNTFSVYSTKK